MEKLKTSQINRKALKVLTQSDGILGDEQVGYLAAAMSLLSEYLGGYTLFETYLENASEADCRDLLQKCYQSIRTDDDRKNMGRHYTPNNLVRFMCKDTLGNKKSKHKDLALERKLKEIADLPVDQRLGSLLRFSTADISCGSGVFLVRAAKTIGLAVARTAFQSDRITLDQLEHATLLASERCIYGVDKDPLAVELCKLSLWLSATQNHRLIDLPLPPLSNIRCGDSLIGVDDLSVLKDGIPDRFYQKLDKDDKDVAAELRKRNKQERSRFKITSTGATIETLKTACNIWTSIFFIPKVQGALVPTTYTLQCALNGDIPPEQQAIVDHVNEVAKRLQFFHWRLEFPEVFLDPKCFQSPLENTAQHLGQTSTACSLPTQKIDRPNLEIESPSQLSLF